MLSNNAALEAVPVSAPINVVPVTVPAKVAF